VDLDTPPPGRPDPLDPLAAFRLDGRVAIVTGASSGLGARFARVLHAAGAQVVVTARRRERLAALVDALPGAVAVPADLTAAGAAEELVAAAVERLGRLDLLVNNAGATADVPALDLDVEEFRAVVEVNLTAPFAVAQAAARRMVDQGGGVIVNVASQYGMVGVNAGIAAYAGSKGGLVNLTRQLAVEWARQGVRVNALAPGYFPSEMTADFFADDAQSRWLRRTSPMGRGGEDHELDGALLFLASDASSYVTGAVLAVDGGWTAV
jgi:NAD(P)-dependent dehydrogenase (short-subunit alcohol dehydrogenase family)